MVESKSESTGQPSRGRQVAEVMDSVRWEYDPEDELLSPLVSTERYFRDFPWEGSTDDISK